MSEQNKGLARRVFEEIFHKGNLALVNELYAPNFVAHREYSEVKGPESYRQLVAMYRTAFPDLRFTIEDQIAEGDKVVTRWRNRGTHKGELVGEVKNIPPTGKQVAVSGIVIHRIVGGKFVEQWEDWDRMSLMQQLGVIPAPERAAR